MQETIGHWYDYGAGFYDPALGRWHSVDPLSEDYFSLSPYTYCANNPLRFIDPNGQEIRIYYTDEDGNEQRIQYTAGVEYDGDNEFVNSVIGKINQMAESEIGKTVIDKLSLSENNFTFTNTTKSDGNGLSFATNITKNETFIDFNNNCIIFFL